MQYHSTHPSDPQGSDRQQHAHVQAASVLCQTRSGKANRSRWLLTLAACISLGMTANAQPPSNQLPRIEPDYQSNEYESFTEPLRQIELAAPEVGVMADILVQEGTLVKAGQVVARLDDQVYQNAMLVAKAASEAQGSLEASKRQLENAQYELEGYRNLRKQHNATDREVQRAETSFGIAQANVQVIEDEARVRAHELQRAEAQLDRRKIRSPINGVVVEIRKDLGEFVSPSDPVIMTIVDLTQLRAIFSFPMAKAKQLRNGQSIEISFSKRPASIGVVEFISPMTKPQTATCDVKVRIDNTKGALACGELCRSTGKVVRGTGAPKPTTAQQNSGVQRAGDQSPLRQRSSQQRPGTASPASVDPASVDANRPSDNVAASPTP